MNRTALPDAVIAQRKSHVATTPEGVPAPRRAPSGVRGSSGRPLARRAAAFVGVATLVLGVHVTAALAGDFTLRVSAPSTVYVGKPAVIRVTGTIPPRAIRFLYFVTVVSIRTQVLGSCPANSWDAAQIANATGGSVLVLSSRAVPDGSGRFTVPVGIRPYAPGRARICAYTYDGEVTTLARATRLVTVRRARSK